MRALVCLSVLWLSCAVAGATDHVVRFTYCVSNYSLGDPPEPHTDAYVYFTESAQFVPLFSYDSSQALPDGTLAVDFHHAQGSITYDWTTTWVVKAGQVVLTNVAQDFIRPYEQDYVIDSGSIPGSDAVISVTAVRFIGSAESGFHPLNFAADELRFVASGVATCQNGVVNGIQNWPLTISLIPQPNTQVSGHWWAGVKSDCLHSRRLVLFVGGVDVAAVDVPGVGSLGQVTKVLAKDYGPVAVGTAFSYVLYDDVTGQSAQVANGVVGCEMPAGAETCSDFYDQDKVFDVHCDDTSTPTPSPSVSPSVTPSPSPTATPNQTPGPTPTPTAGIVPPDSTPPLLAPSPLEFATPTDLAAKITLLGEKANAGAANASNLAGMGSGGDCWQSSSFGSVGSLPINLSLLSHAFPSGIPIPTWAGLVRAAILYTLGAVWFIVAFKCVAAVNIK